MANLNALSVTLNYDWAKESWRADITLTFMFGATLYSYKREHYVTEKVSDASIQNQVHALLNGLKEHLTWDSNGVLTAISNEVRTYI